MEEWLARTESLALRHGEESKGLQRKRSNTLTVLAKVNYLRRDAVNWEDGFSGCLLLRHEEEDGSLGLVGSYFDCDTLDDRGFPKAANLCRR